MHMQVGGMSYDTTVAYLFSFFHPQNDGFQFSWNFPFRHSFVFYIYFLFIYLFFYFCFYAFFFTCLHFMLCVLD